MKNIEINDEAKKLYELTSTKNVRSDAKDAIYYKATADNNISNSKIKSRCIKLINIKARENTYRIILWV